MLWQRRNVMPIKAKKATKKTTTTRAAKAPKKTTTKTAAKKPATKKVAPKKTTTKTTAKKSATKKPAAKKSATKKVAGRPGRKPSKAPKAVKVTKAKKTGSRAAKPTKAKKKSKTAKAAKAKKTKAPARSAKAEPAKKTALKKSGRKSMIDENLSAKDKLTTSNSEAKKKVKESMKAKVTDKIIPINKETVAKKQTEAKVASIKQAKPASKQVKPAEKMQPSSSQLVGLNIAPYGEKSNEEYMNPNQHEHFRKILLQWKDQLLSEMDRTMHHLQDEAGNFADPNDRATQEEEFSLELRTRDRELKLIKKIEEALQKIDEGEYGYCDSCGIEIGIRRLEARPTANLCIDCKTLDEIREKQMGG